LKIIVRKHIQSKNIILLRQKTKLLSNEPGEGVELLDPKLVEEYKGLNSEEVFFLEMKKKMEKNDKNIKSLTK